MDRYAELVDAFADASKRNRAIVALVGAINARDLRVAKVSPGAKAALIAGLEHPNAKVRWWCLQLMDHLADESYLLPLLSRLSDPVAKVRRHAIHALRCGACKPDRRPLRIEIAAALRTALETDPDPRVREEAREALEGLARARQEAPREAMADRRLTFVALSVSDLRRSVRFYREILGVPLEDADHDADRRDPWYGGEHAACSWTDGAFLHFAL